MGSPLRHKERLSSLIQFFENNHTKIIVGGFTYESKTNKRGVLKIKDLLNSIFDTNDSKDIYSNYKNFKFENSDKLDVRKVIGNRNLNNVIYNSELYNHIHHDIGKGAISKSQTYFNHLDDRIKSRFERYTNFLLDPPVDLFRKNIRKKIKDFEGIFSEDPYNITRDEIVFFLILRSLPNIACKANVDLWFFLSDFSYSIHRSQDVTLKERKKPNNFFIGDFLINVKQSQKCLSFYRPIHIFIDEIFCDRLESDDDILENQKNICNSIEINPHVFVDRYIEHVCSNINKLKSHEEIFIYQKIIYWSLILELRRYITRSEITKLIKSEIRKSTFTLILENDQGVINGNIPNLSLSQTIESLNYFDTPLNINEVFKTTSPYLFFKPCKLSKTKKISTYYSDELEQKLTQSLFELQLNNIKDLNKLDILG